MTHKPIGRGRQVAVVAIFGLLSRQRFHPVVEHRDLPLQVLRVLLQASDGLDGFCQRFTQDLFLLLKKLHFLVFFVSEVSPGFQFRLKLFHSSVCVMLLL